MKKFPLQLETDLCTGCEICVSSCLYDALTMEEHPVIDVSRCQLCKSCIACCPADAWHLESDALSPGMEGEGIWVFAEVTDGEIAPVTFELLAQARVLSGEISQPVSAVLIGEETSSLTAVLFRQGADNVYTACRPEFSFKSENLYAGALAGMVKMYKPAIFLIGATRFGRNVAARTAALVNTGLTADCTALAIDPVSGLLRQSRPAFGGNLMATIETPVHRPQMATIRPHVFSFTHKKVNRTGEVIAYEISSGTFGKNPRLLASEPISIPIPLGEVSILVAGGRGMHKKENIPLLYRLAEIIGGEVAGSRGAVEAGWIPFERQIGQTGQTVSPDLYIACGISGQIQHTAGITGNGKVIAINNDPQAPIFQQADYGIVGDVEDILPRLIRLLRSQILQ